MRAVMRWIGHQRWIRFGIRDRLLRVVHNPDKAPMETFQVPFFGKQYPGNFSTFLDWSVYYYGAYAFEELELMRDVLQGVNQTVVLDIGANIGHHTLFASTVAEVVHSFEPFPEVFSKIYEKIELNGLKNVTVHENGLGEINGVLPYQPPQDCNTGTGSFVHGASWAGRALDLPIRNGDEQLDSLGLQRIDFIKMDIEGFEPQALRGLRKTLQKHRPVVFFEWSAGEREVKADVAELFPEGYLIFNFEPTPPKYLFFCSGSYHLQQKDSVQHDGNKIAIPKEYYENESSLLALKSHVKS